MFGGECNKHSPPENETIPPPGSRNSQGDVSQHTTSHAAGRSDCERCRGVPVARKSDRRKTAKTLRPAQGGCATESVGNQLGRPRIIGPLPDNASYRANPDGPGQASLAVHRLVRMASIRLRSAVQLVRSSSDKSFEKSGTRSTEK